MMNTLGVLNRVFPSCFAGIPHGWEILCVAQGHGAAASSPQNGAIPGRDMQDKFPDAMRVWYRVRSRLLGRDAGEDFVDGISMPRFPFKRPSNLVGKSRGFRHVSSWHESLQSLDECARRSDSIGGYRNFGSICRI